MIPIDPLLWTALERTPTSYFSHTIPTITRLLRASLPEWNSPSWWTAYPSYQTAMEAVLDALVRSGIPETSALEQPQTV